MHAFTHLIRQTVLATTLLISTGLFGQSTVDTAVTNILKEQVVAWNTGDATLYASHFSKQGTFTNIQGIFFNGYDSFYSKHAFIFRTFFKGTNLQMNIVSARNITPDVAIVETLTWVSNMSGPTPPWMHLDAKARLVTRLLQVFKKQNDRWEIMAYHNVDVKPNMPVPEPNP